MDKLDELKQKIQESREEIVIEICKRNFKTYAVVGGIICKGVDEDDLEKVAKEIVEAISKP